MTKRRRKREPEALRAARSLPTTVLTPLEGRIVNFERKYRRKTIAQKVRKMGEEFGEIMEALVARQDTRALEECADLAILLVIVFYELAHRGEYGRSLTTAMDAKLDQLVAVEEGRWPN